MAFGTSAEIRLGRENSDRLHRAGPADPDIAEPAACMDRGRREALADDIATRETLRAAGRVSRPPKRSRSKEA